MDHDRYSRLAQLLTLVCVSTLILPPDVAFGWGAEHTHLELARAAISRADGEDDISAYLRDHLKLRRGRATELAVQIGFDPVIDAEIGPAGRSRLNRSRNLLPDFFGPAPDLALITVNQACAPPCLLDRSAVQKLIVSGTWSEDNPNSRARHHFHDPTFEHRPPLGNHGLNDQKLLPGLQAPLNHAGEFFTWFARGGEISRYFASILTRGGSLDPLSQDPDPDVGNFQFRGRSAPERALNEQRAGSFPSTRSPTNLFALPDTERYLYRGLTAAAEDEREHYLALHFIAFGHSLHLLQDNTSPGHVRNDFVNEHLLGLATGSFETAGDGAIVVESVIGQIDSANFFESKPNAFLVAQLIVVPPVGPRQRWHDASHGAVV